MRIFLEGLLYSRLRIGKWWPEKKLLKDGDKLWNEFFFHGLCFLLSHRWAPATPWWSRWDTLRCPRPSVLSRSCGAAASLQTSPMMSPRSAALLHSLSDWFQFRKGKKKANLANLDFPVYRAMFTILCYAPKMHCVTPWGHKSLNCLRLLRSLPAVFLLFFFSSTLCFFSWSVNALFVWVGWSEIKVLQSHCFIQELSVWH